ncbi:MAG TPA: ABC transporter permease [Gaiellaceae bacterium]|nr:ABC transporter permease [Gaiellaceae bacterium]
MVRFVLGQLRTHRARTLALLCVLAVAPAATVLLVSSAHTQSLQVRGTLTSSYRVPYDILVRPKGSRTPLEESRGLVQDNYLSGLFGGITLKQLATIRSIRYVDVAAPIANIGFVQFQAFVHVPLAKVVTKSPFQLYRVNYSVVEQDGTTRVPMHSSTYLYYSTLPFQPRPTSETPVQQTYRGQIYGPCSGPDAYQQETGKSASVSIACLSGASPGLGYDYPDPGGSNITFPRGEIGVPEIVQLPMLVAAIDPAAEAKLVGLKKAVVSGRYLEPSEGDQIKRVSSFGGERVSEVPMLLSSRTFVDANAVASIERLDVPPGTNVPARLASASSVTWLPGLKGRVVGTDSVSAASAYRQSFGQIATCSQTFACSPFTTIAHWTASPTEYRALPGGALQPLSVQNPRSIWQTPATGIGPPPAKASIPRPDRDVQFRRLRGHLPVEAFFRVKGRPAPGAFYKVVGTFDPSKLAGFSTLSRLPMETYYPPELEPADARTKAILHGRPLLPSLNIGDYVAQPPLLLTSLDAIRPFIDKHTFLHRTPAPISVVRIRVQGSGNLADAGRIRLVAAEIHRRTGLDVDITAGSSPRAVTVDLPRGRFGRPALSLREGWSQKGVTLSFLDALDRKTALLGGLIPLVALFVVANGAAAVVRSRRREIGVLSCVGWSGRTIFLSVLAEVALIGVAAGLLATAVAAAIVAMTSLQAPAAALAAIGPAALLLALIAGSVPAARAARLRPLVAVEQDVSRGARRGHVRTLLAFAVVGLRGRYARTLPSVCALAIGVAALALLLTIQSSFGGSLLATVLGDAISVQTRGLDYVAVGLILVLSGAGLADALLLSVQERRAEFALLQALGWGSRPLRRLVVLEAALLGALGAVLGSVVALIAGFAVGLPGGTLVTNVVAVGAGGVALALVASLVAVVRLRDLVSPAVLAGE